MRATTYLSPVHRTVRRILCAASLLVCPQVFGDEDNPPTTLTGLLENDSAVTVATCPNHPSIIAAYTEHEARWTGRLAIYHRTGDTIDWEYSFPEDYEKFRGHYVVRFRWVTLPQVPEPVLEIIESTHMGNGSLRVFEIENRSLRLLGEATIRGRFWFKESDRTTFHIPDIGAEALFEGEHLRVSYREKGDPSVSSIHLGGMISVQDMGGNVMPPRRFEQIHTWDKAKRLFVAEEPTSPSP